MLSVNTNYSAMIALQNLNMTNSDLESVQNRINTGLKVASAVDNGAVFAIAEGQRTRVSSLSAIRDMIDRAYATVEVALKAGEGIGTILKDMKAKAVAAQASDLTANQLQAIQADYTALASQVARITASAQFNGKNLVNGVGAANDFVVLQSDLAGVTSMTITAVNLTLVAAPGLGALGVGSTDLADAATSATSSATIDTAINTLNTRLATFGSQAKALDIQRDFLTALSDTVEKGIGNLVDADLAKESAKLQSLQIKQQLGAQALSIANQSPQVILSLFGR
jgi:flagellin